MSASREQIAPLALSSPQSLAGEEGEAEVASKRSRVRRRRCLICGGCCGVSLLVLAVVIVVLAFTVFRVRDPEITINGMSVQRMAVGLPTSLSLAAQQLFSLNLTLLVDLSVKNPNAASVRFGPSTTAVFFHGSRLGEAYGPAGNSRAHRTFRMNVTVDIMAERVMADAQLLQEVLGSGVIDVTTSTRLGGRVKLLGVIRRHVDVIVNCSLAIEVASQSLRNQNCDREVRL